MCEIDRECVCVREIDRERERERVCVCVCVCDFKSERVCVNVIHSFCRR